MAFPVEKDIRKIPNFSYICSSEAIKNASFREALFAGIPYSLRRVSLSWQWHPAVRSAYKAILRSSFHEQEIHEPNLVQNS
ncbi:hypothetical protein [Neptuniibacter halophilus]|uniref:hypothetical protein n=1 Tax=Neptuniibacter halophilus TaxID=651666 RepID=UPI002573A438|nr:hypothetical protein [Neptuniibacter halophilus]